MIFQVEFAHPYRQAGIVPDALVKFLKVGIGATHAHGWKIGQVGHCRQTFELAFIGAAAAITPAAEIDKPVIDLFLPVICPRSRDRKSTRLNSSHVKISYA